MFQRDEELEEKMGKHEEEIRGEKGHREPLLQTVPKEQLHFSP